MHRRRLNVTSSNTRISITRRRPEPALRWRSACARPGRRTPRPEVETNRATAGLSVRTVPSNCVPRVPCFCMYHVLAHWFGFEKVRSRRMNAMCGGRDAPHNPAVPARHVLLLPDMPRQPRSARSSAHALPLRASHRAHRAPHGTRPLPSACSNLSCGTRCRCPLLARPLSTTVRHKRRPLRRPSRAVARSRDARRAARAAASAAATGEEATGGGGSERRRHRLRRLRT